MSGYFHKKNTSYHPCSVKFGTGCRQKRAQSVVPVFLPFSGCPMHCVYCAQDRQTGSAAPSPVAAILAEAEKNLNAMPPCAESGPRELAFYGGTFTALPAEERRACLAMLERTRRAGRITHARCSTRPDALSSAVLDELRAAGVSAAGALDLRRGPDGPALVAS